jgi:hypothetical protein
MNGIALLLMAATLGVEYDWQALDDGQIEYTLIVEPDFIPALGEGSEIRSSVPDVLESVQRLCIRIAHPAKNGVVPQSQARKFPQDAFRSNRIGLRAAEPMTFLWKALAQQPEETLLVRYGWQPTKEGQLEYFVQIDPKLLRTLAPGDEIYATLTAEAGHIDTFVVFSNAKQLPKVAGKPAIAPRPNGLGATSTTNPPAPGAAPFAPAPFTAPNSFGPAPTTPASSTSFGPPAAPPLNNGFNSPAYNSPALNEKAPPLYPAPPRTFGVNDDPANDLNSSRVNPAAGYGPTTPAATDSVRGYQWENNRTDLPRPNLNSPNPGLNPPANQPFQNDTYGTGGARNQQQPFNNQPPANDLYPNNFANNQNGNLRPNGPQLPSAGNAPYRPTVGYPQDNNVANQGYNNQGQNNQVANNQGFNNNQPVANPQAVGYGPMNDNQVASLPNNSVQRPGLGNDPRNPGIIGTNSLSPPVIAKQQPWWPMVFVTFFLFVSLGANLYLVWTAMEFYSRYRLAVERLRTSGTRA